MKKNIILLFSLFILSSSTAFAQKRFEQKHAIGLTGGVAWSYMSFGPTNVSQKMHLGPSMGLAYRYLESKYFGLQIELLYTQRGWKDELKNYPQYHFSRTLNYFEIPFLSHIYFGNDRINGFFNIGPKIGLFFNDHISTNIVEPIPNYLNAHHTLEVAQKIDYGITAGVGMEVKMKRHSIMLEGRFYFGLNDLFPNEKKDVFETSSNQNISVAATYLFYLKK